MKTSDSFLRRMLRYFKLNRLCKTIKILLPASVVDLITNLSRKNVYIPHVLQKELEPKYASAWRVVRRRITRIGDYLEFGVSRGDAMACMYRVLRKQRLSSVRLFGFDSFKEFPSFDATNDAITWQSGQHATTIEQTTQFLNRARINWRRVLLINGRFDDTLNPQTTDKYNIRKASIIMIACNMYPAAKAALNYSLPLIIDYTIIFFNDWREDTTLGECQALSEFLRENKHLTCDFLGDYKPTGKIFLVTNTEYVW